MRRGFALARDAIGFHLPTSIAPVPRPGTDPKDPAYFVTELNGVVKVVTNDRTVLTFAEAFFTRDPVEGFGVFPSLEIGLAGICLEPAHGYVFVTFVKQDSMKVLRNSIARFTTRPEKFALKPTAMVEFDHVFAADRSAVSHQIGNCAVHESQLFVGVGDGQQPSRSQDPNSSLGKVLRMTLDGRPFPGNPLLHGRSYSGPAGYVWALGLRNPFGIAVAGERVFAADNGNQVDRFLELRSGTNHLWAGSDDAFAVNTAFLIAPGRGVAQLSLVHGESSRVLPSLEGSFLVTVSGDTEVLTEDIPPQILQVKYDSATERVTEVPEALVRYRSRRLQVLAAAGVGPDGLFFAPLFPDASGVSAVYRLAADSMSSHPFDLAEVTPAVLMRQRGCFGCHSRDGTGSSTGGPTLDREPLTKRLSARLASRGYSRRLDSLEVRTDEPFVSWRDRRRQLRNEAGSKRALRWIEYHLLEPRFDNPSATMPNLGLTTEEAALLASYLLNPPEELNGERRRQQLLLLGLILLCSSMLLVTRRTMRSRRSGQERLRR